jgi:hypothetical protein
LLVVKTSNCDPAGTGDLNVSANCKHVMYHFREKHYFKATYLYRVAKVSENGKMLFPVIRFFDKRLDSSRSLPKIRKKNRFRNSFHSKTHVLHNFHTCHAHGTFAPKKELLLPFFLRPYLVKISPKMSGKGLNSRKTRKVDKKLSK